MNIRGANRFAGKKFSVLGDSISTLAGYNPAGYAVFYEGAACEYSGIRCEADTWWGQVVTHFRGELLANNSFSGSCVAGRLPMSGNSDERTFGLHKNDAMPDVIIVYLGLNDFGYGVPPRFREAPAPENRERAIEYFDCAYKAMLAKLRNNYPEAEVWCSTLCLGKITGQHEPDFWDASPDAPYGYGLCLYNAEIKKAAAAAGCHLVDFSRHDGGSFAYESFDGSHPTREGMDQLANVFVREMGKKADLIE